MMNLDHSFPPPPSAGQSSVELLKRAIETYCASFGFCIRLYRFPIIAFFIGLVPFSLFDHKAVSLNDYIQLGSAEVWFFVCAFISAYSMAFRTLALQRMVLSPGMDFVCAMAYANRFGKRGFYASLVVLILQGSLIFPFLFPGFSTWQSKPGLGLPFGVPAALLALACIILVPCLNYLLHCFRFSLATTEGSWTTNLNRAMTFVKAGFARGFGLEVLMCCVCSCLYWLLSPETYYYLPQIGKIGLTGVLFPHYPPAFMAVTDGLVTCLMDFVTFPVCAIWGAYFVNDVRLQMADSGSKNI